MHADIVQACLERLASLWKALPPETRPDGFWVIQHSAIDSIEHADAAPIEAAWFVDGKGIRRRTLQDADRFLCIQSGQAWAASLIPPPAMAAFNSRPGAMHAIGIARIGPMPEESTYYMDYMWGGLFGRASKCRFDVESNRLVEDQVLWVS